ncbi:uncharacterized protein LOC125511552 [Triticum urartu]|uniref:uncharacterized protein LOC125511552 n=1 Tax=Triticum urartu TaxID=4572 RepID=UPI002043CED1|nr:uncharacterized protein LOC125511552 [Triticum urartu]
MARAMDLTRGLPPASPGPRNCLAIQRFGAASVGRAEDSDRDPQEAQARPRRRRRFPTQDQQELSASPDPWTATTETPRSSLTSWASSTARSSALSTMISHRTR